MKVVGVYTGSTVVSAFIEEQATTTAENGTENDNPAQAQAMQDMQNVLADLVEEGTLEQDLNDNGLTGLDDFES